MRIYNLTTAIAGNITRRMSFLHFWTMCLPLRGKFKHERLVQVEFVAISVPPSGQDHELTY